MQPSNNYSAELILTKGTLRNDAALVIATDHLGLSVTKTSLGCNKTKQNYR